MKARRWTQLVLASFALLLAGCEDEIDSVYGERSGLHAGSVNGTSVFSEMCVQRGHNVRTALHLSPRTAACDCIVWFPDDFEPPTEKVRDWFDDWLCAESGRTLIFVGRDFDAARRYWRDVEPLAPPSQQPAIKNEIIRADLAHAARRAVVKQEARDADWFEFDPTQPPREVKQLDGEPRWTDGVRAADAAIELGHHCRASFLADEWLTSGDDTLVWREEMCDSQIIGVVNGSFLVNYGLVNRENRKLAGKLLDELPTQQKITFLESGPGGPSIHAEDPSEQQRSGWEIIGLKPFDTMFLQMAVAGLVFAVSRLLILGRPRAWRVARLTDFGKHVAALGNLLERGGDRRSALARVQPYHQPDGKK